MKVLTARDDGHSEVIYELSRAETECLLNLFEHRQECIILFDKSVGTKYENVNLTKNIVNVVRFLNLQ